MSRRFFLIEFQPPARIAVVIMYQRLRFLQDGIAGIGGPCGLTGSFTGGFPGGPSPWG
jgi:hypothetical protein